LATQESPFWSAPTVTPAIERLAQQDALTIVVGAGASVESGFPLWGELVWRLLVAGLRTSSSGDSQDDIDLAAAKIYQHGPLAAASYAKTLLGANFEATLRSALYQDVLAPSTAGNISLAAARLYLSCGGSAELLTLNYDEQLYSALQQASTDGSLVKAINNYRARPNGERFVRHIHGRLYGEVLLDSVVLTEEDYFAQSSTKTSRENFMRARFDGGPTLFIGTSLADSNLLSYLHAQKKIVDNKHVAVFTDPPSSSTAADRIYRNASAAKWRKVGVTALQNRLYGQTAQFLHEVRLAREQPTYLNYPSRLSSWERGMAGWLHRDDQNGFLANQDTVHEALVGLLKHIKSELDEHAIPRSSDGYLAIELWSRRPSSRSLRLEGSTLYKYAEQAAMPRLVIAPSSADPVVAAFTDGARVLLDVADEASPWGAVLAMPLILDDHPEFWRLPVGALVVRSTLCLAESVLSRVLVDLPDIDDLLVGPASVARELLDPLGSGA